MKILAVLLTGLCLAVLQPRAGSCGEYEETERRLKSAGIDAPLREDIHAAIDRGTAWLRGRQQESGAWDERRGPRFNGKSVATSPWAALWSDGVTALSGLALQHAGSDRDAASARRAFSHLTSRRRAHVMSNVYVAAIAALLCQALDERKQGVTLSQWVTRGFRRKAGLWGYGTGAGATHGARGSPNLSTSQFACLGLWSGQRLGMDTPKSVWRSHLAWLIAKQLPDGSWPYERMRADWTSAYPTAAFMGLADLLLAKAALESEIAADPALRERVLNAELRGRSALRRFARWKLHGAPAIARWETLFPLYGLYALEKAAVFADVEALGATRWYQQGAEKLIALQEPDGSWDALDWIETHEGKESVKLHRADDGGFHATRVLGTAFALLFLLRVSEAHRPPERHRAVTESAPQGDDAGPAGSPRHAPVVLRAATELLRTPTASNDDVIRALDRLHEAYETADVAWQKAAERTLLSALPVLDLDKQARENRRARVAVHAARLLADTDARVVPSVRAFLEKVAFPEKRYRVGVDLFEACFDVLARYADERTLTWMIDEAVSVQQSTSAWVRTGIALTSLDGFHGVPAEARRKAAQRLLRRFLKLEETGDRLKHRPGIHAGSYWRIVKPDVLLAALDLIRAEPGDASPRLTSDKPARELFDRLRR